VHDRRASPGRELEYVKQNVCTNSTDVSRPRTNGRRYIASWGADLLKCIILLPT
jgi:hypothetical protein